MDEMQPLTPEQFDSLVCAKLADIISHLAAPGCTLGAALLVSDGAGVYITPLRLSREQVHYMLAVACQVVDPSQDHQPETMQ